MKDIPLEYTYLQAFGGLSLSRLIEKVNSGKLILSCPVIGIYLVQFNLIVRFGRDVLQTFMILPA